MLKLLIYRIKYVGIINTGRVLIRTGYHILSNLTSCSIRKCRCCNRSTLFLAVHRGDESIRCIRCGANRRFELLAVAIRALHGEKLPAKNVLELDPESPLYNLLRKARSHTRTYFASSDRLGLKRPDGAQCEDITRLTIPSNSIDLIISSDVLEHVQDLHAAFSESVRVLRDGGMHLFTVPWSEKTVRRAMRHGDGIEHLMPEVRHLDPINPAGSLVFWDFGPDFSQVLKIDGLSIDIVSGPEGPDHRLVWCARKSMPPNC
jgi:SAM-dependent methyltransferase